MLTREQEAKTIIYMKIITGKKHIMWPKEIWGKLKASKKNELTSKKKIEHVDVVKVNKEKRYSFWR